MLVKWEFFSSIVSLYKKKEYFLHRVLYTSFINVRLRQPFLN